VVSKPPLRPKNLYLALEVKHFPLAMEKETPIAQWPENDAKARLVLKY
jgi:hypothetical protein